MLANTAWVTFDLTNPQLVGGKAASLAKLQALNINVPRAIAVTDRLFRTWAQPDGAFPQEFEQALATALQSLPASRWSVRSSFALEDDPEALAAGVFESCVDVPTQQLLPAIRTVLLSGVSAAAVAYTQRHNKPTTAGPFAVLIHPFVPAQAAGHVACVAQEEATVWVRMGTLPTAAIQELKQQANLVAAQAGASELEWAYVDNRFTWLQWRPYKPAQQTPWVPQEAAPVDLDVQQFLQTWRWDSAHNPAPLSAAHQGLVQIVGNSRLGYAQQVVGGYLFYKPTPDRPAAHLAPAQAEAAFADLANRVNGDRASYQQTPSLPAALDLFVLHYETLLGPLGQAAREGRQQLVQFLTTAADTCLPLLPDLLRGVPSSASQRQALWQSFRDAKDQAQANECWEAYVLAFGDEAAAWDLAAPTIAERSPVWQPSRNMKSFADLEDSLATYERARNNVLATLQVHLHAQFLETLALARTCLALGENDDALYARLQAPVRRALLHLGEQLVNSGQLAATDDVFHLPLEMCLALHAGMSTPPLAPLVENAKALSERQRLHPPPAQPPGPFAALGVLQGHGTGGTATGKVVIYTGGSPPRDPTCVVLARTLLPTQLPLVEAAALITETGGPLDHVATQARERGLPAVVGVALALEQLCEGDLVLVDANTGVIHRLRAPL